MHEDDELHDEGLEGDEFEGTYIVDDDTLRLLEVVVGMVNMLGQSQVDETARDNCFVIADELASRFAVTLGDITVEEIIHEGEVLYKPPGGVMGDEPIDDEPESPEGSAPE